MPRIDETAYRQLKATPTERELYTPTLDERLLAQQHTTGKPALVAFLVLLKTFQHLRSQNVSSLLKNSIAELYEEEKHRKTPLYETYSQYFGNKTW